MPHSNTPHPLCFSRSQATNIRPGEKTSIYIQDADEKFEPFRDLLARIELLEELANSHLMRKSLRVTDADGLRVSKTATKSSGGQLVDELRWESEGRDPSIDLDSLSSGEQHEIILLIDLLFNVSPGALVLIDEPEISLHVAWQIAFIPDVCKIAAQSGFRFVVATHSPQIINNEWSRAHRLGPEDVSFE